MYSKSRCNMKIFTTAFNCFAAQPLAPRNLSSFEMLTEIAGCTFAVSALVSVLATFAELLSDCRNLRQFSQKSASGILKSALQVTITFKQEEIVDYVLHIIF
jgi:hypothetical protein